MIFTGKLKKFQKKSKKYYYLFDKPQKSKKYVLTKLLFGVKMIIRNEIGDKL